MAVKTFVFEAVASELDLPVLVLKNIRSQWFGQTDVIFERVLRDHPKFSRRDEVLLIVARGAAEEEKRAINIEQARYNMVEQQIRPWDVLDQDVLDLLRQVRREDFVPEQYRKLAFSDMEIPLGHGEAQQGVG